MKTPKNTQKKESSNINNKNSSDKKRTVNLSTDNQKSVNHKNKWYIIIGSIVIVIALVIGLKMMGIIKFPGSAPIKADNYNLLVITMDTTRPDHIGAYGYAGAKTPNLDYLCRQGVMFSNCYTSAPLTLTAHCSIFTGKFALSHNVRDNGHYTLSPKIPTLATQMKEKNYHTGAIIASYVLSSRFGLNKGFDYYDDSLKTTNMYNTVNSEIRAYEVFGKTLQWLNKNHPSKTGKPFFTWIHFYDPHIPYNPPSEFANQFKNDMIGSYDAEVAYMDSYIGKIMDTLKSEGILDNTIIVLVGDHGEAFGEHGEYGHGIFCYEETLKVPLIFYNEKLFPKGLRIDEPVNVVDITPTLLDIFGIHAKGKFDGISLVNLLNEENNIPSRPFYFESMHGKEERNWAPLMGLIEGKHKYISLPEPELYDLQSDPSEKNNLFWKMNRQSKEMDQHLMKYVASAASNSIDSRRQLTAEDKKHLQSLGYISSFSDKNSLSQKPMDPKKAIAMENVIKDLLHKVEDGRLKECEEELPLLRAQNPDVIIMPTYYDLMVRFYTKKNQPKKSFEILSEGITKFPGDEQLNILYALTLADMGQFDASENHLRKMIERNPSYTAAYISLGELSERKKDIIGAVSYFKKAVQLEPQNIPLKMKYADILSMKSEFASAMDIYNELLNREEVLNDDGLLYKIALFNFRMGSIEKAEQLLKQTIEMKPKGSYYFYYALTLGKENKFREAIDNMRTALDNFRAELDQEEITIAQKAVTMWQQQMN